jgi:hypothetical protein
MEAHQNDLSRQPPAQTSRSSNEAPNRNSRILRFAYHFSQEISACLIVRSIQPIAPCLMGHVEEAAHAFMQGDLTSEQVKQVLRLRGMIHQAKDVKAILKMLLSLRSALLESVLEVIARPIDFRLAQF